MADFSVYEVVKVVRVYDVCCEAGVGGYDWSA